MRVGAVLVPLSTLLRPPSCSPSSHRRASRTWWRRRSSGPALPRRPRAAAPGSWRPARRSPARRGSRRCAGVWAIDDLPAPAAREDLVGRSRRGVRPADDLVGPVHLGQPRRAQGRRSTPTAALRATAAGLDARCVGPGERPLHPDAVLLDGRVRRRAADRLLSPAPRCSPRPNPSPSARSTSSSASGSRCSAAGPTRPPGSPPTPRSPTPTCRRWAPAASARCCRPSGGRPAGARANLFGMTETFGPYCGDRLDTDLPPARRAAAAGRSPASRCGSSTPTPAPAAPGEQGEIRLRGRT